MAVDVFFTSQTKTMASGCAGDYDGIDDAWNKSEITC